MRYNLTIRNSKDFGIFSVLKKITYNIKALKESEI